MKADERMLFYRFRYYFYDSKNRAALCKFLKAVNWQNDYEKKEGLHLLNKWSPCSFEDALYLLSCEFCANDYYQKKSNNKEYDAALQVRNYAVERLSEA